MMSHINFYMRTKRLTTCGAIDKEEGASHTKTYSPSFEVFLRKLEKHIVSMHRRWYNGGKSARDESIEDITEAVKRA